MLEGCQSLNNNKWNIWVFCNWCNGGPTAIDMNLLPSQTTEICLRNAHTNFQIPCVPRSFSIEKQTIRLFIQILSKGYNEFDISVCVMIWLGISVLSVSHLKCNDPQCGEVLFLLVELGYSWARLWQKQKQDTGLAYSRQL